jgi:cyclase
MIKKRIIPTLTYMDTGLVKSTQYQNYRFIGDPIQAINVNNLRDVDELLFVDISTSHDRPNMNLIMSIMENAFMPVTIGGGIRSLDHIQKLLKVGADKVCLATAPIEDPSFVQKAVDTFGGQAIVISVDYIFQDGKYKLVTNPDYTVHEIDVLEFIKTMSGFGISEFILTSVEKDGMMNGYDMTLAKEVVKITNAGIIINGGASSYEDMYQVFNEIKAEGVAASSIFQYTEQTPVEARKYLKTKGINTREIR